MLMLGALMAHPATAQTSETELFFELDPTNLTTAFANPDPVTAAPALACTRAHWLWPNFCKFSHITKIWGPLARCSIIWVDKKPYHIRWVFRLFRWGIIVVRPLPGFSSAGNPVGQQWEEIHPDHGRTFEVTGWVDNDGDGDVSAGDQLDFDDGSSQIIESTGTGFSAVEQDETALSDIDASEP
jgi:hypothetical protein